MKQSFKIYRHSAGEIQVMFDKHNLLIDYLQRCGWKVLGYDREWSDSECYGRAFVNMQVDQLNDFRADMKSFYAQVSAPVRDDWYSFREGRLLRELRKERRLLVD